MTMQTPAVAVETGASRKVYRLGFWTAILTAAATATALGLAVTTPPRSGPFCTLKLVGSCIDYPYTDVVAFVPGDYLWIYPALLMAPLFAMLVVCIHHYVAAAKQIFSQIALVFAVIAATVLAANYFVQLTVIQPSLLKGETASLSLWSQYNPHGIFIALEDLGYLTMGVAFLFLAPLFDGRDVLARVLRLLFFVSGGLAIGSLVALALRYGSELEYRYEVVVIVINWLTLIIAGVLLNLFFRRAERRGSA